MFPVQKEVRWIGSSLRDLRELPSTAQRELGLELLNVQRGAMPGNWKPMPSVRPGVVEIRVQVEGAYRLMYVAGFVEAIYVLHVFEKKTRKTAQRDLALGRARLARIHHTRGER